MPAIPRLRLGVNVDHVATVRNARGGAHPDPVKAAQIAIAAGADGITAHLREDRRHIRDDDSERWRWLDVRWDVDDKDPQRFPARILVQSLNEPGTLAQIAQIIAEHDGNIDNIRMTRRAPDFTDLAIDLEVYDLKHLNAIIAQLRAKPVVAKAERVTG